MEFVVLFLIAAVTSFIGSLQAGLVNTAVLTHTVQRGREAGRRMAIGGALPELLYSALAYLFADLVLMRLGIAREHIGLVVGAVLSLLGAYFLLVYRPSSKPMAPVAKVSGIRKGVLIGLANPQLIIFWCGVVLALHAYGIRYEGLAAMLSFALGAFIGALVLLLQLVKFGRQAAERWRPERLLFMFRLVGALLLASGAYAVWKVWT